MLSFAIHLPVFDFNTVKCQLILFSALFIMCTYVFNVSLKCYASLALYLIFFKFALDFNSMIDFNDVCSFVPPILSILLYYPNGFYTSPTLHGCNILSLVSINQCNMR